MANHKAEKTIIRKDLSPSARAEKTIEPTSKAEQLATTLGISVGAVQAMGLDEAARLAFGQGYTAATMPRTEKGAAWLEWYQTKHGVMPTPRQLQTYEAQFVPGLQYPVGSTMWQHGWSTAEQAAGRGSGQYGAGYFQPGWFTLPTAYPQTQQELAKLTPDEQLRVRAQYLQDAAQALGIDPSMGYPQIYGDLISQLRAGIWGEGLALWRKVQSWSSGQWLAEGQPDISMGRGRFPYTAEIYPQSFQYGLGRQYGSPSELQGLYQAGQWGQRPLPRKAPTTAEAAGYTYATYRPGAEGGAYYPRYAPSARWLTY